MSNVELATAYITLVPQMKGIEGEISKGFSGGAAAAQSEGAKAGTGFSSGFGGGLKSIAKGVAALGVASIVVDYVKDSIAGLARIETINAQTQSAITSTGGAAGVTAEHVHDLGISLEGMTAQEAESIQEGENLLLTFTNIQNKAGDGNDIFDQAAATLVDYSVSMGVDASQGAIMLGKALNDPIKGITALSKAGVTFTDEQKEQIKAMVAVGDTAGAQKVILGELNKEFGGAGAAYAATAAGQWYTFTDALGDFGQSVLSGAMPALTGLMSLGTGLLGVLTALPGPVLAGVAAMGAMVLLKGPIGALGGVFKSAFETVALNAMYARDNVGAATGVMGKIGTVAVGAVGGIKALGSGLLASLGGVPGLIIIGTIVAITAGISALMSSQAAEGRMAKQTAKDITDFAGALTLTKGAVDQSIRQKAKDLAVSKEWADGQNNMTGYTESLGVEMRLLVDGMVQVPGASAKMEEAYQTQRASLLGVIDAHQGLGREAGKTRAHAEADLVILDQQHTAYGQLIDVMPSATAEIQRNADAVRVNAAATTEASDMTVDATTHIVTMGDETKKTAEKSAVAATDMTGLAVIMGDVGAQAATAKRELDGFSAIIDKITGRNQTLEEAQVSWNDAVAASVKVAKTYTETREAAANGDAAAQEALDKYTGALASWDVATLTSTDNGKAAYGAVDQLAQGYLSTVSATYSAAEATGGVDYAMSSARLTADGLYNQFIDNATAMGLTTEQAQALATKVGVLDSTKLDDKTMQLLANDTDAQNKMQNIQVYTIDGKTVYVDGNTGVAYDDINALINTRFPPATVPVQADTSAASTAISTWMAAHNNQTLTLFAKAVIGGSGDEGGATGDWGSFTQDVQPWLLHRDEHILDSGDVAAMGGQAAVYAFRASLHGAAGGDTGGPVQNWKAAKGTGTAMVFNVYQQPGQTAADLAREMNRVMAFQGSI